MVQAKLVDVRYWWKVETRCPRCKKKVEEKISRRERAFNEDIEIRCSCGLIFKETVDFQLP